MLSLFNRASMQRQGVSTPDMDDSMEVCLKTIADCIICNSSRLESTKALVAPFVAQRVWGRKSFSVDLLHCSNCRFAFFNPRLEAHEEERLYEDYRSDEYQQMRFHFEPWYTKRYHENLFSAATMRSRCEAVRGSLAPHIANFGVRSILDFGGGRGELISDLVPGADRYLYDLSDNEPLPGVRKLRSLSECKANPYDLIICSNVLEHVADPREVLRQMIDMASPGTLIFVEVPYESPFTYRERGKRALSTLILLARRPSIAVRLLQPGMLYVMHEHVNFFSPPALQRLMDIPELQIAASGSYGDDSFIRTKALWSLGRVDGLPDT